MRWLYWAMFNVEIMSDEQMQKAKRVITPWVLVLVAGAFGIMAGLFIVTGNQTWYPFWLAIGLVVVYAGYSRRASVQALIDQNPSRYLPAESKAFKRVKRGIDLLEFFGFFYALQNAQVWPQRALRLGALAIFACIWSWVRWRRLNRRLHIDVKPTHHAK